MNAYIRTKDAKLAVEGGNQIILLFREESSEPNDTPFGVGLGNQ
jgi:hypothetical protein